MLRIWCITIQARYTRGVGKHSGRVACDNKVTHALLECPSSSAIRLTEITESIISGIVYALILLGWFLYTSDLQPILDVNEIRGLQCVPLRGDRRHLSSPRPAGTEKTQRCRISYNKKKVRLLNSRMSRTSPV